MGHATKLTTISRRGKKIESMTANGTIATLHDHLEQILKINDL